MGLTVLCSSLRAVPVQYDSQKNVVFTRCRTVLNVSATALSTQYGRVNGTGYSPTRPKVDDHARTGKLCFWLRFMLTRTFYCFTQHGELENVAFLNAIVAVLRHEFLVGEIGIGVPGDDAGTPNVHRVQMRLSGCVEMVVVSGAEVVGASPFQLTVLAMNTRSMVDNAGSHVRRCVRLKFIEYHVVRLT